VFFEGAILLSQWAFKTEGFGHGDTQLMMGVGAFLGVEHTGLALLLGFVLQAIWAIPLLVWQWIKHKEYASLGSGVGALTFACLPLFPGVQGASDGLLYLSMAIAIVCLVVFLRQIQHKQHYTYVPLGPALVAGSLISLGVKVLSKY
jgi:prepilin signal peptidase PulO-like enzyme (type II secretory pathway)